MKVLILSVTAGEGHNATAAAIERALTAAGAECRTLDTWREINRGIYYIVDRGYLLVSARMKRLYAAAYRGLEKRKSNSYRPSLTRLAYRTVRRRIARVIDEYQPDVIVYTHVFAGTVLDVISEKKPLRARTVGIVTDFAMHPFWEECLRTDRVVIANEKMLPGARLKGLSDHQIMPIGIPIRPAFATAVPQAEARAALGLDPDRPAILLMGGSMGYGALPELMTSLDALPIDFQIVSVCGRNEKIKAKIDAMTFKKKVLNFGYTDQISLLMDACDCIVSKPGGLTTSEALAKRLPMIIVNPIPGQEDRNTDFLLEEGVAHRVSEDYTLAEAVYDLFSAPDRVEEMRRRIDLIRKPNATADLVACVLSLGGQEENAPAEEREGALVN